MPLSRLYIYSIAHSVDSVEDHLARLESADISPGLVALELPESGAADGGIRSILKQSPATGIAWWYVARRRRQTYQSTEIVSGRPDTEFEAGRRFADEIGVPAVPVDLPHSEFAERYATWWRRLRDTLVLVGGYALAVAIASIGVLYTLVGLTAALGGGMSVMEVAYLLTGLLVIGFTYYRRKALVIAPIGTVARWYRDRLREIRDEVMYDNIVRGSQNEKADSVLLVVGAAHATGIISHAEHNGIEYEVIESPAIENYEGDLDGITLERLAELLEES